MFRQKTIERGVRPDRSCCSVALDVIKLPPKDFRVVCASIPRHLRRRSIGRRTDGRDERSVAGARFDGGTDRQAPEGRLGVRADIPHQLDVEDRV